MAEAGYVHAIFKAGGEKWGRAFAQVAVVGIVSLIPLFCGALRQVLPADSKVLLLDAFAKAFLGGQLAFYAVGFIATITWQSNKDFQSFFPLRTLFNLFCTFGLVICSVLIGYDPTFLTINKTFLAYVSVGLFISSMAVYVIMALVEEVHVNVRKSLTEDDNALSEEVRASRGV